MRLFQLWDTLQNTPHSKASLPQNAGTSFAEPLPPATPPMPWPPAIPVAPTNPLLAWLEVLRQGTPGHHPLRRQGAATHPMVFGGGLTASSPITKDTGDEFVNSDVASVQLRPLPALPADQPQLLKLPAKPSDSRAALVPLQMLGAGPNHETLGQQGAAPIVESITQPFEAVTPGAIEPSRISDSSTRRSPIRSPDERNLERAETKHRAIVRLWRESGSNTAAKYLEHYLDATGSALMVDRDEARRFAPIRDAEAKNDNRFQRSLLIPQAQKGHAEKLMKLEDGESVAFKDNWDVAYGPADFARQALSPATREFASAFGRLQLKSKGEFTATRHGDRIDIDGDIDHGFIDRYDFHEGQLYASDPLFLERHGRAKPFERNAAWRRRLKGSVRLENGRLTRPQFTWEDADP